MLVKLLTLCLLIAVSTAEESDVLDLTDDTFHHELDRHENTLVMFYAPWCGHCKRLKPEYAKAANKLIGFVPKITLAKIDCTESGKEICGSYSINGYPTLKIFAGREFVKDYEGPRDVDGIVKYMKGQVGPPSKELHTDECYDNFLNSNEIGVVGCFEKADNPLATAFHAVTKKLKEKVRFAHTYAKDLLEKLGHKNAIILHRPKILHNKFESNSIVFEGGDSIADIHEFIQKNYFGLVGVRSRENVAEFKNPLVVAYYKVDYVKNPKVTNYWRNRILKVAKEFPKITFAVSSKDDFQHELNDFGVEFTQSEKPVVLAKNAQNQKFVMREEFSVENLKEFVSKFEADKLEPYLKSEPIPEDNSGPVKVAVAKNFDEVVTNNDKDTLIEFYAPWCGHCKKLAPVFEELGDKMADEDVEIVKFDATANDVPAAYEVRGFPTLFWVPKDNKNNPVKYEGGRDLEDFVQYIAKHATNPLKGFDRKGKPVKAPSDEL